MIGIEFCDSSPRKRSRGLLAVYMGRLTLYYSDETVIAFRVVAPQYTVLVISENVWSQTTGSHMAYLRKHPGRVTDRLIDSLAWDQFDQILRLLDRVVVGLPDDLADEILAILGDKEAARRT